MFRIVLFGTPQLRLGTVDLSKAITGRSLALLVYLAVTGKAQDRNILADLLWDNLSEAQAKKNLRYVLYDLRQAIGDYLLVSRQALALNRNTHYWLDVEVLSSYLHSEEPKANVDLYKEVLDLHQGEFLDGFYIQDAPIFEEWLSTRRRHYHAQAVQGFHQLAQEYLTQRNYEAGLWVTQRLLTLEPWNEEAHRQQMRFLAYSGRRSAALAQYEVCRQALSTEYSVEPLFETVQLYKEIKAGRFSKALGTNKNQPVPFSNSFALSTNQPVEQVASPQQPQPAILPTIQVNWDAIPVPPRLFGRTQELARLEQWIYHKGCRLISIGGLGGQGKSVLVAEAVRRLVDRVEEQHATLKPLGAPPPKVQINTFDSIFWCSLAGVSSFAQLIAYWWRWCGALAGLTELEWLEKDTPPEEQLAYLLLYLRQQRCLLILDQVEHVLQADVLTGAYKPGWEQFGELLRRVAECDHQSCLIIIGREEPSELAHLTHTISAVRLLSLRGLSNTDSIAMLRSRGFVGTEPVLTNLAEHYAGLPLALSCVSVMHQHFPTDQLSTLFVQDIPLFDELHNLFDQQVKRLSSLEHELLLWLTIERVAVPFDYFWHTFTTSGSKGKILDAYQSLLRRSLLQLDQEGQRFRLPALVLRYTTQHLIDLVVAEITRSWQVMTEHQPALSLTYPPYGAKTEPIISSHHRFGSALGTSDTPPALSTAHVNGEQALTLPLSQADKGASEKGAMTFARQSLPFTYLRRYQLVNPSAAAIIAEEQKYSIVTPIMNALHNQWSMRATYKRLQELLDTLAQDFDIDMTTVAYNLRQLLGDMKFTK